VGEVINLDHHRPHQVTLEKCRHCGKRAVGVVPRLDALDLDSLQCWSCSRHTSAVTHTAPEGVTFEQASANLDDTEWIPRGDEPPQLA
jgi:hypothetical protein